METGDHCKSDCLQMTIDFKSIVRELRAMRYNVGHISRSGVAGKFITRKGKSHIAPEWSSTSPPLQAPMMPLQLQQSRWACLPPELLSDIIQRVEAIETSWPGRRAVVACASVCRSWRQATKEVVKTPEQCGWLTFPISLKQPGPRDVPIQCFIKRNRATSTFQLYLGLSPALSGDSSKLLLAAKKIRRATFTDFLISLAADEFSRTSNAYVGKLRSNFLGTKFTIVDKQPPGNHLRHLNSTSQKHITRKHLPPRNAAAKHNVGTISYELNVLRTRGPRRMWCIMHFATAQAIQAGVMAPAPMECTYWNNEQLSTRAVSDKSIIIADCSSSSATEQFESTQSTKHPLILKNKAPRWHEQLQCWCLNFKGRVTVASVKNFQLVAAAESNPDTSVTEQDTVILQFGKIGKDIFTMDYRYPLSAFQAFSICLSSFDTKPACE